MKRIAMRAAAVLITFLLIFNISGAYVAQASDEAVSAVISQLEAIDTMAEIQAAKYTYTVKNRYCDSGTTNATVIKEHTDAQNNFETYAQMMFSARAAAQQAYDALTPEQQAMIDPALVAKLDNSLPTKLNIATHPVTPSDDEYVFEAVRGGVGYSYEVSHQMVSGKIVQTFILVDTSNGATEWTPSGRYSYGESNYDVAYCCDIMTELEYTTDYKRINLEDSSYYGDEASKHIRAIMQNSYPFITMDEMKANLKKGGMDPAFVDSLTRSDLISGTQMAIWSYANAFSGAEDGLNYFATIEITKNVGTYFTPLHDHNNEYLEWLPGKYQRTYDADAAYRVNNLAYYLCSLEGVEPEDNQVVISDIKVTRADLEPNSDNTYNIGMYVYLNNGGKANDDIKVTATSYSDGADGTKVMTSKSLQYVNGRTKIEMTLKAKPGDEIKVSVDGTQNLEKNVYFYEAKGGRDTSQSLVGVAGGPTKVHAEQTFRLAQSIEETGLRIYKTETGTGHPLSDITFDIYRVDDADTADLNATPTEAEIAKYAVPEKLAGSVITDISGYAEIGLEKGVYMVVEQHNAEKVKEPAPPFYISVPTETVDENGNVTVENMVSVYPKNEPTPPPEEPPIIPPTPDGVKGIFEILKHDAKKEDVVLEGAEFAVYRLATETDPNTKTIECEGIQYLVTPVIIDGEELVLKTDEAGLAASPELDCGVYFLEEIKAPNGYNMLRDAILVNVESSAMTEAEPIMIANEKGSILPSTGGIGTVIFIAVGGTLTILAALLLVVKKRMSIQDDVDEYI